MLIKFANSSDGMHYHWNEMTFCCRWDSKHSSVLCLGVDDSFQTHLQQSLRRIWPEVRGSHVGSLLVPLMEAIVAMYDESIWSIRNVVRQAEKVRNFKNTKHTPGTNKARLVPHAFDAGYESLYFASRSSKTRHPLLGDAQCGNRNTTEHPRATREPIETTANDVVGCARFNCVNR